MALITFGPHIEDMRKKAGFSVYSKNRYGNFMRGLRKPKNPKSTAQTFIRDGLKLFSQTWRTLNQANITAWNNLASQLFKSGRLGHKAPMTGETLFIANNQNTRLVAASPITTCPTLSDNNVPQLSNTVFGIASGVVTVNATAPPATGIKIALYSSGIISAGKNTNSKYKYFGVISSTDTLPSIITTMWTTMFGTAPIAGEVVYFETKAIDTLSGFASLKQTFRVVAS